MSRKKSIKILLTGALVFAAAFGVIAFRSVSAAAERQTTVFHAGFGRGVGGGVTDEALASALGITTDELNTAYQTASEAALDQAVQAGLVTQAQADQLKDSGRAFPFGGRWEGWLSQNGIDYPALLADALGITVDELQAAKITAYNTVIDQAVADGRLTQEQADLRKGQYALSNNADFLSAIRSAFESAVQQAVQAGVITQAQADQILANSNGAGKPGLPGFDGFGKGGGFHGGGFRHGVPGQMPSNPQTPAEPSTTPAPGSSGL